ncbi:MAG: hypothetical protein WEA61_00680 [Anaerolineales bacterium]
MFASLRKPFKENMLRNNLHVGYGWRSGHGVRPAKGRQADAPRPAPHLVGFEFTQNERAQVLAAIKSDPELKRTLCQAAG